MIAGLGEGRDDEETFREAVRVRKIGGVMTENEIRNGSVGKRNWTKKIAKWWAFSVTASARVS